LGVGFSRFAAPALPGAMTDRHARDFITHLAMEGKVSASTQNQAFSALVVLLYACAGVGVGGNGADAPGRAAAGDSHGADPGGGAGRALRA